MSDRWRSILREPLVHFVALGALVFAAHAALGREPALDQQSISPSAAVKKDLEQEFTRKTGRAPTAAEAAELAHKWARDEVLFREAVRLGLDDQDPVVRERLISKMKSVVEGLVIVPEPTDADLEAWLAADRARYQTPVRWDLEHAFVKGSDAAARSRAERVLDELDDGAPLEARGDPFASGARHENRSAEYLARTFGKEFAHEISRATPNTWQLVRSDHGWHAVRVTKRAGGEPPTLAALRGKLARDWMNDRKKKRVAEKLAELERSYRIEVTP